MATMVDKEQRSDTASVENEMKPRWNMTTSQSRRFIMYWASNNCEMQLYATELYAKKSHGNGMAIFALPLENWKRLLEDENASIAIYTMLQTLLRNDEAVTAAGIPVITTCSSSVKILILIYCRTDCRYLHSQQLHAIRLKNPPTSIETWHRLLIVLFYELELLAPIIQSLIISHASTPGFETRVWFTLLAGVLLLPLIIFVISCQYSAACSRQIKLEEDKMTMELTRRTMDLNWDHIRNWEKDLLSERR